MSEKTHKQTKLHILTVNSLYIETNKEDHIKNVSKIKTDLITTLPAM